jgi:hypothetical protein
LVVSTEAFFSWPLLLSLPPEPLDSLETWRSRSTPDKAAGKFTPVEALRSESDAETSLARGAKSNLVSAVSFTFEPNSATKGLGFGLCSGVPLKLVPLTAEPSSRDKNEGVVGLPFDIARLGLRGDLMSIGPPPKVAIDNPKLTVRGGMIGMLLSVAGVLGFEEG